MPLKNGIKIKKNNKRINKVLKVEGNHSEQSYSEVSCRSCDFWDDNGYVMSIMGICNNIMSKNFLWTMGFNKTCDFFRPKKDNLENGKK